MFVPCLFPRAPHLFAENKFMSILNEQIIDNLNTEKVTVPCHDTVVSLSMKTANQIKLISRLPQDPNSNSHASFIGHCCQCDLRLDGKC